MTKVVPIVCVPVLMVCAFCGGNAEAQADQLQELIANVRANEALYENFEIRLLSEYGLRNEGRDHLLKTSTREEARSLRCVLQRGLMYISRTDTGTTLSDEATSRAEVQGYDGEYTRIVIGKGLVNQVLGRQETSYLFRPHTWLLFRGGRGFPLSVYLTGGKQLQSHPLAGNFARAIVKTRYVGEEKVGELPCVKLAVTCQTRADRPPGIETFVWLAPSRNYLPVKREQYNYNYTKEFPLGVGVAEDFREIGAGVWLPFRMTVTTYDERAARLEKHQVESNVEVMDVEFASLNPNYDISLFRDIKYPDGAVVYQVKDGKIVDSYVQGGGPAPPEPERSWLFWLGGVLAAALVLTGLGWGYRRFRSRPRTA